MKQGIHPEYGSTTIRCACGNVIETKSTSKGTIQVEICSACHPFFTGKQKLMDTAGRIDRFRKKFGEKIVSAPKKVKKATEPPASKSKKSEKAEKTEKPAPAEKAEK